MARLAGPSPGFSDPVLDAQATFHAVMHALSQPGTVRKVAGVPGAPSPLPPVMGAVALTLLDFETTVWCDAEGEAADIVRNWLRFHTSAKSTDNPADADFALVTQTGVLPDLSAFRQGTDIYPDRSTTLLVSVEALGRGKSLTLSGPGIDGTRTLSVAGLPARLTDMWPANRALFPRGVDLVLTGPDGVAGLPRTTVIKEA